MKRETIALDLDDVVVETAELIIKHVNSNYGASMTLDRFYSRDPSIWGASDIETAVRRVNDYLETDEYFNQPPVQEAILTIRSLQRAHSLFIVTGRPDFTEPATRRWLNNYLPDVFEEVVFTNYFDNEKVKTKGDVCRALGATVLIDDHIDHCFSAIGCGVRPILFGSYPWNQSDDLPPEIQRAKHWSDVEKLLLT